ncbi:MAG TPA: NADH-quinone oxidoreductase subunit N [Candidatus Dormibacteraeota bacterium]|jgi:NADH-quinone oxidoreductase subunit N|nr:NADH-quinone oxidoreductase subunit N [Candidatus Dormibacteraeota bacterium]
MHVLAAIPPLKTPSANDLIGLLPVLVMSGGFIVLMLLDLVVPARRRGWLAAGTVLVLAAAMGVTVWGWFDAATPRTIYFDAMSYDRFSLFADGIIIAISALVVLISPGYLNRRGLHYGEYYALILGAATGMMLLAGADSLMVIFLGIELLSIALYILSGFARTEERSQEAAMKYLLLGGFASGILLYGMVLIYGETGHTQLPQIAAVLHAHVNDIDPLFLVGVGLLFVGFAFKVSAAPFHFWTPDVYQGAPTSVTTFMSVGTKVAAFTALIRVFSYTFADSWDKWNGIVAFVAIISMVGGNVAALTQTSLKRMLAYSSIAQAGYILIGVAVQGSLGTIGALYYLAAYAATQIGAFAVITVMSGRGEDLDSYDGIKGLAYRRPYVAAAMALFLLSLGGFPPTAGFFGKFFIFGAAIQGGQSSLALWGIATSVISVFYYLRIGLLMYQRPKEGETHYPWPRTSLAGGGVLLASAAGTLVLGIFVFLIYSVATSAQHAVAATLQ